MGHVLGHARISTDESISCNGEDNSDWSPLRKAVVKGDVKCVRKLLNDPRTDVNLIERDEHGDSPCSNLYIAVKLQHKVIARELLQAGADVNNGVSPLFCACQQDDLETVHLLLSYQPIITNSGDLFHMVCSKGNIEIARTLIEAGVQPDRFEGQTPLHVAVQRAHHHIVKFLCDENVVPLEDRDKFGRTPLMIACIGKDVEIVNILLNAGANVNSTDKHGRCPLHFCVGFHAHSQTATISLLLERGANWNITDSFSLTPPNYSLLKKGHQEALRIFYCHGADILPSLVSPNLVEGWQDLDNLKLLVLMSIEYRPFVHRVLRDFSIEISEDLRLSLNQISRNPSTLQDYCRLTIRTVLQSKTCKSIKPLVNRLPLPSLCKQFLVTDNIPEDWSQHLT